MSCAEEMEMTNLHSYKAEILRATRAVAFLANAVAESQADSKVSVSGRECAEKLAQIADAAASQLDLIAGQDLTEMTPEDLRDDLKIAMAPVYREVGLQLRTWVISSPFKGRRKFGKVREEYVENADMGDCVRNLSFVAECYVAELVEEAHGKSRRGPRRKNPIDMAYVLSTCIGREGYRLMKEDGECGRREVLCPAVNTAGGSTESAGDEADNAHIRVAWDRLDRESQTLLGLLADGLDPAAISGKLGLALGDVGDRLLVAKNRFAELVGRPDLKVAGA